MALTPERIAELERLKAMMREPAAEAQRKAQAIFNAEKGAGQPVKLPTDKAKGGSMRDKALKSFMKGTKAKERLYHGTGNLEGLTAFDPSMTGKGNDQLGSGFYFTTHPDEASGYATAVTPNVGEGTQKMGGDSSPGVIPARLAIRKPIKVGPEGQSLTDANVNLMPDQVRRIMEHVTNLRHPDESPLNDHFDTSGGVTPRMINEVAKLYAGKGTLHMLENDMFRGDPTSYRHALHNVLGYDGVMKDFGDGRKHYVAWFPNQIKSAIGNRGTYDPNETDITKAKGGQISQDAMQLAVMNKKPAHLAIGGQGPRNWMKGVDEVINPLKGPTKPKYTHINDEGMAVGEAYGRPMNEQELAKLNSDPMYARNQAVNKWIDSNLANYIRKQMSSPDDPIRNYADKRTEEIEAKHAKDLERIQKLTDRAQAEADPRKKENLIRQSVQMRNDADHERTMAMDHILHMANDQMGTGQYLANGLEEPDIHRRRHGGERMGKSEAAQAWEDATDVSLGKTTVGDVLRMGQTSAGKHHVEPWMEKADPSTEMFHPTDNMHAHYLGFDHIVDILKQDLDEGRITPEQLNKVSIEQAVRRTAEYNQERTKTMQEAKLKRDEGMPVHKDYGDGNKWIELAFDKNLPEGWSQMEGHGGIYVDPEGKNTIHHPNREKLEDALKYEGDTMGHCVGGYTNKVMRGDSRIFSLRDKKNEPHVTIEVTKGQPRTSYEEMNAIYRQADEEANQKDFDTHYKRDHFYQDRVKELQNALLDQKSENMLPRITQIFGKSNKKPKKDYIPFVQDFVKGGNWSDVGTIENSDLKDAHDWVSPDTHEAYKKHGIELPKYATEDELNQIHNQYLQVAEPQNYKAPQPIKKAEGGNVQLTVEQMRQQLMAAGKGLPDISQIGANEAPNMPVKSFVIPENGAQGPLPMGGVDMSPQQPGQQMLPANAMQPNPLAPQQPQPPAGPAPQGGSNILQMTPQGQKMAALAGSPQGNLPPPKMAVGGPVPVQNHPFQASGDRPMPFMAKDGGSNDAPMNNNYSDNGATDFSIDNIQQLADGGQPKKVKYTPPGMGRAANEPPLPRVAPMTRAEIEQIALRMAPQIAGQYTPESEKTQKQFAREQKLKHEIHPVASSLSPTQDVDLSKHMDKVMVGLPGDYTTTNQEVRKVAGRKLKYPVIQQGGSRYGETHPNAIWASQEDAAQSMLNLAKAASRQYGDADVLANHIKMGPDSAYYAKHYVRGMLSAIESARLTRAQKDELTQMLREKQFGYGQFPNAPHVKNMEDLYAHIDFDPNFRRHVGALMNRKYATDPYKIISGADMLHATSEPELRNLETGVTGHSIGELHFDKQLTPSTHSTYSHDIPGKFLGKLPVPVPYEMSFPDAVNALKKSKDPEHKKALFGSLKMFGARQKIDQQLVDEIGQYRDMIKKLTGKKKGGVVKKSNVTDNLDTMRLALTRNKKAK